VVKDVDVVLLGCETVWTCPQTASQPIQYFMLGGTRSESDKICCHILQTLKISRKISLQDKETTNVYYT
jgi:hypothetical protein